MLVVAVLVAAALAVTPRASTCWRCCWRRLGHHQRRCTAVTRAITRRCVTTDAAATRPAPHTAWCHAEGAGAWRERGRGHGRIGVRAAAGGGTGRRRRAGRGAGCRGARCRIGGSPRAQAQAHTPHDIGVRAAGDRALVLLATPGSPGLARAAGAASQRRCVASTEPQRRGVGGASAGAARAVATAAARRVATTTGACDTRAARACLLGSSASRRPSTGRGLLRARLPTP